MEEKPCRQCGVIFTAQKGRPFCSRGCYYQNLRERPKKEGVKYRMVTRPGHPIAPPGGVLPLSRVTLYDKIGPGPHSCNWCEREVTWEAERYSPEALLADHLNHDPSDDRPENLVAACNACNAHRRKDGDAPPIGESEKTVIRGGRKTRAVELFCQICANPFLVNPAEFNTGRGRTCSRSCARPLPRRS